MLANVETNVHLLKYDSVHGPFRGEVKVERDTFNVGYGPIKVLAERDPSSWIALADSTQSQVVNDRLARVLSWYDNEWGFSVRMCDAAVALGKLL